LITSCNNNINNQINSVLTQLLWLTRIEILLKWNNYANIASLINISLWLTRCSIIAIFISLGFNISLRKKSKCMGNAFEKKNTRYITRIFFISIGFFFCFFSLFLFFKADFTKVFSLRTQLASVSNYFVLFPTIFCLFQRMERSVWHIKASASHNKKGRCKYTNARMGEADISRSRYWKIECSGVKLGKVGHSFILPPSPSLSLSGEDLGSIHFPYIFDSSLFFWSKSRVKNMDHARPEIQSRIKYAIVYR